MLHGLSDGLIQRSWAEAKSLRGHRLDPQRERAPFPEYSTRPVEFMRDVLGFEPWLKQRQMAEALINGNRRVLSHTCNGAGKSTLLAQLIVMFMATRYNARVITTAGVGAQVRALWRKVRGAHETALRPLPGTPTTVKWELGSEWWAEGLTTDAEAKLQGHHSWTANKNEPQLAGQPGGLLAVIDEASGVEPWVFHAMQGYMTTPNCYWIVMGNPNAADTAFHQEAMHGDWTRFAISAFDVPDHIIGPDFAERMAKRYGEDSPQYQVRVLGQFPSVGGDFLVFPISFFEATCDIIPRSNAGIHIGVDVARGNADYNTIVVTDNARVVYAENFHSPSVMTVVKRVEAIGARYSALWGNVHIDVTGLGAGVVDRLREKGKNVDGVVFGGKALGDWPHLLGNDVQVLNRRAELYWVARTALNEDMASVPEKYRNTIWKECNLIQFLMTPAGKLQIEAKDKIRQRYEGQSPDFADAWVMTFSRARSNPSIMFI